MGFIDHSQLLSTAKRKALHPQASMSSPDERRPSTFLRLTPDAPVTTDRRPSTFLNLAPDTSNSYPRLPAHRDSVASSTVSNEEPAIQVPRRKSSPTNGPKVLKLGPTYWGEHLDENKDDFHESV